MRVPDGVRHGALHRESLGTRKLVERHADKIRSTGRRKPRGSDVHRVRVQYPTEAVDYRQPPHRRQLAPAATSTHGNHVDG